MEIWLFILLRQFNLLTQALNYLRRRDAIVVKWLSRFRNCLWVAHFFSNDYDVLEITNFFLTRQNFAYVPEGFYFWCVFWRFFRSKFFSLVPWSQRRLELSQHEGSLEFIAVLCAESRALITLNASLLNQGFVFCAYVSSSTENVYPSNLETMIPRQITCRYQERVSIIRCLFKLGVRKFIVPTIGLWSLSVVFEEVRRRTN